ncbi:MAG: creatininase family protein [Candidatus Thermoplasmatota archaeon]|nr:creatininase family protein [Candidatus Thermoplasmatota archaeon]
MKIEDMTSHEFASAVQEDPVVILPMGALEEHGPHLPLSTDMVQPLHVVEKAAEKTGALVLPPMWYGLCSSTKNFPGTITLSFDTLRLFSKDMVKELARNGVRRVMLISGHAGGMHMSAIKLGVQEALAELDKEMLVLVLSDYDFAYSRDDMEEDDGHGGMLETSRVMDIEPELVKDDKPSCHPIFPRFQVLKDASRFWPEGVHGDASKASGEYGQKVNEDIVEKLVELIENMKMELMD